MFVLFVLVRAASCVVVNSGGVVQVILDLNWLNWFWCWFWFDFFVARGFMSCVAFECRWTTSSSFRIWFTSVLFFSSFSSSSFFFFELAEFIFSQICCCVIARWSRNDSASDSCMKAMQCIIDHNHHNFSKTGRVGGRIVGIANRCCVAHARRSYARSIASLRSCNQSGLLLCYNTPRRPCCLLLFDRMRLLARRMSMRLSTPIALMVSVYLLLFENKFLFDLKPQQRNVAMFAILQL